MGWDYKYDRINLQTNPNMHEQLDLLRSSSLFPTLMEVAAYMQDQPDVAPCHECHNAVVLTEGLCYPCWMKFKSPEFAVFQRIEAMCPESAGQWPGFV